MSRSVANRESTHHRFTSLKQRLLKCSKFDIQNSGTSQNNLPVEVRYLQPMPRLENDNHGENIRA